MREEQTKTTTEHLIFHVDVNSAFLSWESVRRIKEGLPDLRDIPACIGGDPTKRTGIVVAKSIPAKKCGVQTGEPVAMALRKCPNMVIVPSDFDLYVRCSRAFKKICASYTPVMESFSIDEVFLDMTGTSLLYPDPIAAEIPSPALTESGGEYGRNWDSRSISAWRKTDCWPKWHLISKNQTKYTLCSQKKSPKKCGRFRYASCCSSEKHPKRN